MKIESFRIVNYRAIEDIEFKLNYSMNPIIGINESGKTSILQAILAFDKTRDKLNKGEHLEFQNKYSTKATKDCSITANISLDASDKTSLMKKLSLKTDSDDYNNLNAISNINFQLSRNLGDKNYYIHSSLSDNTNFKVIKFLLSLLPTILYFDDFTDRVPETIEFPITYKNDAQLKPNKLREWQEIIEEIFKRAETDGIENNPLKDYMNISKKDTKTDILSDVQDTLNTEIIEDWKKIKKSSKSFADDSEDLELVITNHNNNFDFKVKDKSYKNKQRTFSISERSKGFQWFFNYMVKLKFNPNYKKSLENSIFLLDEPGSYLHSSAQGELLEELKRVSHKNTIIYCTHSQYLLNPETIQLGSIKIAEKRKSKISLENYGTYKETMDKGALSPVYQALQLNYTTDYIGKIIITEGVTDFYLFKLIQKYTKHIDKDIKFIPSVGASQSTILISLALSFSNAFLLFFDNDKAGKNALKKYKKEFGVNIENYVYIYRQDKSKFVLEDFFKQTDTTKLLSLTNTTDVKRALGFLFYEKIDKQEEFIVNLDFSNFKECFKKIQCL